MKIEKINDNQIRCFLTKEEMESRQLHLKELAYGTEKAKRLFRDMMREAYDRCGFEAENLPVMIEAVPLRDDSLVLIITKVDHPEELDTRFSSFSPSVKNGADPADPSPSALGRLLESIRRELGESGGQPVPESAETVSSRAGAGAGIPVSSGKEPETPASGSVPGTQLFTFPSLGKAADAACLAAPSFRGTSSLYRDPADARYYLFLCPEEASDASSFGGILTILSEFGTPEFITPAREQHLREHCEVICASDAVLRLSGLA